VKCTSTRATAAHGLVVMVRDRDWDRGSGIGDWGWQLQLQLELQCSAMSTSMSGVYFAAWQHAKKSVALTQNKRDPILAGLVAALNQKLMGKLLKINIKA